MFLLLDGAENFEANEPQGKTPITLEPLAQMDHRPRNCLQTLKI